MGGNTPKQFLPLAGKPVLVHTVERFLAAVPDASVVVVLPEPELERWSAIATEYGLAERVSVCAGGDQRFHSVKNGLQMTDESQLIAVHDGVRPLVSAELIEKAFAVAEAHGSAIPVIVPTDSFRMINANGVTESVSRTSLRAVQTPQVFDGELIHGAYQIEFDPRFTDDASVVEMAGNEVTLCEGELTNIKITSPADMAVAEVIISARNNDNGAEVQI
jgi:2-C-methyl-D-erythritol 4-phosphate cytidylyltransferase